MRQKVTRIKLNLRNQFAETLKLKKVKLLRCGANINGELCTASTAENFELDTKTMWSTDPQENPPFHDFARVCSAIFCLYENENISTINSNSILNIITPIPLYLSSSPNQVYVPYCSSDLYVGTRDPSDEIRGFSFHGKYIVKVNFSM